jgi:anaerobic selenocysteine-containing dehydrogenase
MVEEEIVKSACRMCHGVCQVNVHLRNNKVIKRYCKKFYEKNEIKMKQMV